MKKNLLISSLMVLLSIIGFSSCKDDKGQEPTPVGVTLTVETTTLSLKVGEQGTIKYTVTPKGTSVTFSSDKPAVATVSEVGVVNGVAAGDAVITVKAGDVSKTVAVTVTADTPVSSTNEVALIKKQEGENDPDIEAHEAKIGRTLTQFPGANFKVYYNENLKTIPLAGYGLSLQNGPDIILMLGRETVKNCPNTRRMFEEVGFVNFQEIEVGSNEGPVPALTADYSKEEGITVLMYDFDGFSSDFPGTTMWIQVSFPQEATKIHDPLNVKDFPYLKGLKDKDIEAIKKFEADLGLRTADAKSITETNALFTTIEEKANETNFAVINYVFKPSQGPAFVNSAIVCVLNDKELGTSEALKTWLTTNGVTNIKFQDSWLMGENAEGGIIQIFYNAGVYLLQATAEPLSRSQSLKLADYGLKELQKLQSRKAVLRAPGMIAR